MQQRPRQSHRGEGMQRSNNKQRDAYNLPNIDNNAPTLRGHADDRVVQTDCDGISIGDE